MVVRADGGARATGSEMVRRRWLAVAVPLVCLLTAGPAAAEWRRLDSPNFVVIGDAGAGTLRDVAVKFESFRETLGRVLSDRVTSTPVPTIVIVFPSERAFAPLKPRFNGRPVELSGQFVGGQDVNYIAVVAGRGGEDMRVVFHEYAHLVSSNVARNLPAWLEEGLAEYYSTYEISREGREAVIGMPIDVHLVRLRQSRLLPLDELLNATRQSPMYNEGERRSVFYAQSWALAHMLLLGRPARDRELSQFLEGLGQGMDAAEAWRQAFAGQPIERELRSYIERSAFRAYRYRFPEKIASFEAQSQPLSEGDARAFVADYLLQQRRSAEAADRLGPPSTPGSPSRWSKVVAALVDIANGDAASARRQLSSIGEVTDWLTAYRAGAALVEASARGDEVGREEVNEVRRLFAVARSRQREFANAIARTAELELESVDGPPAATAPAMERARQMAPGREDYAFLHARVLVEHAAFDDARKIVAPLTRTASTEQFRDHARELMDHIDQLERIGGSQWPVYREGAPGGSRDRADRNPAAPGPDRDSEPGGYRSTRPGEQRTEGALEHVDCSERGATLTVRADGVPQLFTARDLAAIEFITYRADIVGTIGCGPVAGGPRVYVTWRTGAADGERVAVAIEFLPRGSRGAPDELLFANGMVR